MKVYESANSNKRGFNKVPQIKIKNSNLIKSGFEIGKEFTVIYEQNKIILQLNKGEKNYESGKKRKNRTSYETAFNDR